MISLRILADQRDPPDDDSGVGFFRALLIAGVLSVPLFAGLGLLVRFIWRLL